mmetsp:Transcript_87804/g.226340  ORF Transcript_87804/g.226340 Transcript_87804/m.226340 type:complete len:597 (+) Transcript_87804:125-1915(+)
MSACVCFRARAAAETGAADGEEMRPTEQASMPDATDMSQKPSEVTTTRPPLGRVCIANAKPQHFQLQEDGTEVVLLGGNYVMKTRPWFPPVDIVRRNARSLVQGLEQSQYTPPPDSSGRARVAKACVRLGTTFVGAFPRPGMTEVDPDWAKEVEDTIQACAEEGLYVFLDTHQDNMCTTNGGEGIPWWVAAHFQDNNGCGASCASCSYCWGTECNWSCCAPAYVTNPKHPLMDIMCNSCPWLLSKLQIPIVRTVADDPDAPEEYKKDPWHAFAVGANAGDPARMNIGNPSMRLNNCDLAQSGGGPQFTLQCQNLAYRLYRTPFNKVDRAEVFDRYMTFVKHLCSVYDRYSNVVAIELLNEPNLCALPDISATARCRRDLFNFYAAVLEELDGMSPPLRAPIAIDDIGSTLPGSSTITSLLSLVPLSSAATRRLRAWGEKQQLVLSFHYYYRTLVTSVSLPEQVSLARKLAEKFGGVPIWLSEFQDPHDNLPLATELGVNASTWWQYVDLGFTAPSKGWYKYDDQILELCKQSNPPMTQVVGPSGEICWAAWPEYVKTVEDGTFWGGCINGAAGGEMDVLANLKATPSSASSSAHAS